MRLPAQKLEELKGLVQAWRGVKHVTRDELESLAWKLQHACQVVPHGRTFLCRVFELMSVTRSAVRPIRLNESFRSDLQWWAMFFEDWNGVSLLHEYFPRPPDHHVYTDASGNFGCGALWQAFWLQYQWPPWYQDQNITVKELLPIVLACALWGTTWQSASVMVYCDNAATVEVVNVGYSKVPAIMHLRAWISAQWRLSLISWFDAGAWRAPSLSSVMAASNM